ncbi:hypothetical protein A2707_03245 [Candidatus Saccharibacteria bacterium RIFCSPHIGHO2_01_FULL_45_15]|nr:MAG: hypothetical protein A2707_03245 [Candidatus Saccharibacteria bacterium RIFCSPHIGHO2_01_FULL_45_15]OGL28446.1 MAG: hypothetical protein A3C39_02815 [Candidatus Saccharibacteria bacterium RIFCSPHIGHO2_02_FULL_46_12]OGL32483.1 MAG: hypothetical protein A3E76_00325 [Candidatus Saccharibacteria bacterium RIFCSPHIGHO2_12_FULL_44_22]
MAPRKQHDGFTIVELLIVIVVIGILAAIVIVAYQGVTNRANDAAVKSDLTTIAKKLEADKLLNGADTYPTSETDLDSANIKATKNAYDTTINNFVYCKSDTSTMMYAVVAKSKSGSTYYVSNTSLTPKLYTGTFPTARSILCATFGAIGTGDLGWFGSTPGGWSNWVK